ncbi:hypothetical protein Ddye_013648 [Dipteronia dyeriana]|uniref:Uncharacterized protein n=1 Tax=Dipteronia dyeriana TaxID=168575 RepID=A0AAD9X6T6_9ROSI|nr:hypothetical protein Ddye_013648 [Dipteronia dyeriana]
MNEGDGGGVGVGDNRGSETAHVLRMEVTVAICKRGGDQLTATICNLGADQLEPESTLVVVVAVIVALVVVTAVKPDLPLAAVELVISLAAVEPDLLSCH